MKGLADLQWTNQLLLSFDDFRITRNVVHWYWFGKNYSKKQGLEYDYQPLPLSANSLQEKTQLCDLVQTSDGNLVQIAFQTHL